MEDRSRQQSEVPVTVTELLTVEVYNEKKYAPLPFDTIVTQRSKTFYLVWHDCLFSNFQWPDVLNEK